MPRPSPHQIATRLKDGFALDDMWRTTMGLPEGDTKEKVLTQIAAILQKHAVPYAIIGGVAVQVWTDEPWTTRDLHIALVSYEDLPHHQLINAGFTHEGTFDHSDNWRAPGDGPRRQRTVIEFSAGLLTEIVVQQADTYVLPGGPTLRIASLEGLIALKLEAALAPSPQGSIRISDYGNIMRLIEEHPEVLAVFPDVSDDLARVLSLMAGDLRPGR